MSQPTTSSGKAAIISVFKSAVANVLTGVSASQVTVHSLTFTSRRRLSWAERLLSSASGAVVLYSVTAASDNATVAYHRVEKAISGSVQSGNFSVALVQAARQAGCPSLVGAQSQSVQGLGYTVVLPTAASPSLMPMATPTQPPPPSRAPTWMRTPVPSVNPSGLPSASPSAPPTWGPTAVRERPSRGVFEGVNGRLVAAAIAFGALLAVGAMGALYYRHLNKQKAEKPEVGMDDVFGLYADPEISTSGQAALKTSTRDSDANEMLDFDFYYSSEDDGDEKILRMFANEQNSKPPRRSHWGVFSTSGSGAGGSRSSSPTLGYSSDGGSSGGRSSSSTGNWLSQLNSSESESLSAVDPPWLRESGYVSSSSN